VTAPSGSTRERLEGARRLLRSAGVAARVEAAGRELEIAAVSAAVSDVARLRELAPAIRALGFQYVALDLGAGGAEQPAPESGDQPSRELP